MKYITVVLAVCVLSVQGQGNVRPPPPPRPPKETRVSPGGTAIVVKPTPQATAAAAVRAPVSVQPPRPAVSVPRPEGCSPGCGPNEICSKLGDGYCKRGQSCSVCIKMESIRFPASVFAGMFQAQPTPVATVPLPTQPMVPAQQPGNMNSFSYTPPVQPPVNNDPFADLFGFGTPPPSTYQQPPQQQNSLFPFDFFSSPSPQPTQSSLGSNSYDFFSSPPAQQQSGFGSNSNSYMPLLLFEGFGLGGFGF